MRIRNFSSKLFIVLICTPLSLGTGGCGDEVTSPPEDPESISKPTIDQGDSTIEVFEVGYYCCHGVKSSMGHGLELQFAWGDDDTSSWHPALCGSHAWSETGSYTIRARARCKIHPGVMSVWSDPFSINVIDQIEIVTQPDPPTGVSNTLINRIETYVTSGAVSSLGHSLQYQFDWGDATTSGWSFNGRESHRWSSVGVYEIKARARCAVHTHVVSDWSQVKEVSVQVELISPPPNPPTGPSYACPDELKTYATSGAVSNLGHRLQYRFDWGDNTMSSWSSQNSASHSWSELGSYFIRAQARCAIHTGCMSEWSSGRSIPVVETISTPPRPNGPTTATVGSSPTYSRGPSASSCNHMLEYQWRVNNEEYDWPGIAIIRITWTAPGVYHVRVRARCRAHPLAISSWGPVLTVVVTD